MKLGVRMPKIEEEVEISDDYGYPDEREGVLLNKSKRISDEKEAILMMEKFLQKFIDLMLQNQKTVEGLIRSNDALREDIAVMIGKMERLYDKFDEFVTLVKEAAREDTEENIAKEIVKETILPLKEALEKMSEEMKETNENIADLLVSIDKRLKRLTLPQQSTNVEVGNLKEKMMEILSTSNNTSP